jgi:hypothetical protein
VRVFSQPDFAHPAFAQQRENPKVANTLPNQGPSRRRYLIFGHRLGRHFQGRLVNQPFESIYRRLVPRLGHAQAIGAIAHRLCRLIWMILHHAIRYEERGPAVSRSKTERRAAKMIRELRRLGYRVEPMAYRTGVSV